MTRLVGITLAALVALSGVARPDDPAPDVKESPSCKYCGMDRAKFASSRMVVRYDDGSTLGACSLHCVAVDLAVQIDRTPVAILVADLGTNALVDAEQATWVIGGSKMGVMTKRAKWAFAEREAAVAFVNANGGTLATFDEAMRSAYEDVYQDNRMIREKRRAAKGKQPAAVPAGKPASHAH